MALSREKRNTSLIPAQDQPELYYRTRSSKSGIESKLEDAQPLRVICL